MISESPVDVEGLQSQAALELPANRFRPRLGSEKTGTKLHASRKIDSFFSGCFREYQRVGGSATKDGCAEILP